MKDFFSRAMVVGVASPASAGSALEAARNICEGDDHDYVFVHSYGLDPAGTGSARVYLFYSNGNGKNCVVSRKYNLYNLATPLRAAGAGDAGRDLGRRRAADCLRRV